MTEIYNYETLEASVSKMGFLPFYKNDIQDFSVEDFTTMELCDGPWEWKGIVAGNGNCAYGKLFQGKAGFVNLKWFPDLVNYRRSVYRLNSATTDESIPEQARMIYNTVVQHESLLSKEIKSLCGFSNSRKKFSKDDVLGVYEIKGKDKRKKYGFETLMTYLQMGTWIVIADFEYNCDKHGRPYGWGIARYTTPEALFCDTRFLTGNRAPEESKQRMTDYLMQLLPQATEKQIMKIIG